MNATISVLLSARPRLRAAQALRRLNHVTRRELTRNRLSLGISGGVIDHQNLVSRRLKSLDALKRTPQACGPIPGADDNRDSQNLYPCKTKVRIGPIQSARY